MPVDKEHSGAIIVEFVPKLNSSIDQDRQDKIMKVICVLIQKNITKYSLLKNCEVRLSIADITGETIEDPGGLIIRRIDDLSNFS